MIAYNDKQKIIEHYDLLSPYYYSLWGQHLHHGYWVTGQETKEEAQIALVEYLAQSAHIQPKSKILDVGCGFGASSIFLSKNYNAKTTGVTISPVQVAMAEQAAERTNSHSQFILMDAENMNLKDSFDVIWSVESISHYKDKANFFKKVFSLLNPNGTVAILDWFKKEDVSADNYKKYILPIEKGMLVQLHSMNDYISMLTANGLQISQVENISPNVSKTWDISSQLIKNKMFWQLALKMKPEFINFMRSFQAMKSGFASGNFVYGMIVAKSQLFRPVFKSSTK